MDEPLKQLIVIDPGDVHVGVAVWFGETRKRPYGAHLSDTKWKFEFAKEFTPEHAIRFFSQQAEDVLMDPLFVIEGFQLDPKRSKAQTRSTMNTPQLIGHIKAVCHFQQREWVEQMPNLRKIGENSAYMRIHRRKHGKPKSKHAQDAEAHGIYYIYHGKGSK